MKFSPSQSMAVQSSISAPLVTVEPALSTPEALGMGRCGQRRKLLRQVVVGVGAGLHHSPLWEDAAFFFSPSNVHRSSLPRVLAKPTDITRSLCILTLWTASRPSTPASCSGELASSAHPPGHSLLFALLKGEVSAVQELVMLN